MAAAQAPMAESDYVCVVLDERGQSVAAQPVASCVPQNGVGSAFGRQVVRHEFLVACRPKAQWDSSWESWWVGVEELLGWAEEDTVMDAAWKSFLHNEVTVEAAAANVTVQVWMQRNLQAQEAAQAEVMRKVADEELLLLNKTRDDAMESWRNGVVGMTFRFVNWAIYASPSKPWNASIYDSSTKKQVSHGYFATTWEAALRVARVLGPNKSRELDARKHLRYTTKRSAKEETAELPTTTARQQQGGALGGRVYSFEVVVPEGCFSQQQIQVQGRAAKDAPPHVTCMYGAAVREARLHLRAPATL
jgi:hypothetical protein